MNVERYSASGAMFENDDSIWWVTGGYNGEYLQSTEVFNVNDNSFTNGIDLPKGLDDHNLITVNSTHMVLLGGQDYTDEVFIIDR